MKLRYLLPLFACAFVYVVIPAQLTVTGQLATVVKDQLNGLTQDLNADVVVTVAGDSSFTLTAPNGAAFSLSPLVVLAATHARAQHALADPLPDSITAAGSLMVTNLQGSADVTGSPLLTGTTTVAGSNVPITVRAYKRSDNSMGYVVGFNAPIIQFSQMRAYFADFDVAFPVKGLVVASDMQPVGMLGADQVRSGINILASPAQNNWIARQFLNQLGMGATTTIASDFVIASTGDMWPRIIFFDPILQADSGVCWSGVAAGPLNQLGLSGAPGQVMGLLQFVCLTKTTAGILFSDDGMMVTYLLGTDIRSGGKGQIQLAKHDLWRAGSAGLSVAQLVSEQLNSFNDVVSLLDLRLTATKFADVNSDLGLLDSFAVPAGISVRVVDATGLASTMPGQATRPDISLLPGAAFSPFVVHSNEVVMSTESGLSFDVLYDDRIMTSSDHALSFGASIGAGFTFKVDSDDGLVQNFITAFGLNNVSLAVKVPPKSSSFSNARFQVLLGGKQTSQTVCLQQLIGDAGLIVPVPASLLQQVGIVGDECFSYNSFTIQEAKSLYSLTVSGQLTGVQQLPISIDLVMPSFKPLLRINIPSTLSLASILPTELSDLIDITCANPLLLISAQPDTAGVSLSGLSKIGGSAGNLLDFFTKIGLPSLTSDMFLSVSVPVGKNTNFKIAASKVFEPGYKPFGDMLVIFDASVAAALKKSATGATLELSVGLNSALKFPFIATPYNVLFTTQFEAGGATAPEIMLSGQILCDDQGKCPTIGVGSPVPISTEFIATPDVPLTVELAFAEGALSGVGLAGTANVNGTVGQAIFNFDFANVFESGASFWLKDKVCLQNIPSFVTSLLGQGIGLPSLPSVGLFCIEPINPPQAGGDPYNFGDPMMSVASYSGAAAGKLSIPPGFTLSGKVATPSSSGTARILVVPPSLSQVVGIDSSLWGISAQVMLDKLCIFDLIDLINGLTGMGIPQSFPNVGCLQNVQLGVRWTPTDIGGWKQSPTQAALTLIPSIQLAGDLSVFGLNAARLTGAAGVQGLTLTANISDVNIDPIFSMKGPKLSIILNQKTQGLQLNGGLSIAGGVIENEGVVLLSSDGWHMVTAFAGSTLIVDAGVGDEQDAKVQLIFGNDTLSMLTKFANAGFVESAKQVLGGANDVFGHVGNVRSAIANKCGQLPSFLSSVCDPITAPADAATSSAQASLNSMVNLVNNPAQLSINSVILTGSLTDLKKGVMSRADITYSVGGSTSTISVSGVSYSDFSQIAKAVAAAAVSATFDQATQNVESQARNLSDLLKNAAQAVASALANQFKNLLGAAAHLGSQAVDTGVLLATNFDSLFHNYNVPGITDLLGSVGGEVSQVLGVPIGQDVAQAVQAAQDAANAAGDAAKTAAAAAEGAANVAAGVAQSVANTVSQVTSQVAGQVAQVAQQAAQAVADAAKELWSDITSIF